MLIAVDIGNSSINIGYFNKALLLVQKLNTYPLRIAGDYRAIIDEFLLQNHIEKKDVSGIISSVVSSHTRVFEQTLEMLSDKEKIDVLIVSHTMKSGLTFAVLTPEEMGADRIASASGAYALYKAPVAVIDFGTATTITTIDQAGNCLGGAIMPGVGLMNTALEQGTSKLSRVELEAPTSALGKDTSGCIRSGLFYGTAGAAERILSEIEQETGCSFTVVVTGGYAPFMEKYLTRPYKMHSHLIMEGLKILYESNRSA